MNMKSLLVRLVLPITFFLTAVNALAQSTPDAEAELGAASEAVRKVAKPGPDNIALANQATLKLPEGFVFIPQPEADMLMKALGNGTDPSRLGLVFPGKGNSFVVVKYVDSGYVQDEEAAKWDAAELFEQLKTGTEATNKERVARGIPPMELVGWVQQPTYDAKTQRLLWSVESKDKDEQPNAERGINYNTYVLGREGYLSLNLVSSKSDIENDKPIATALLNGTTFNEGKAYGDFNASTDKVAEYGIAALVAGAAAKKLGFFAALAAFAAKFAKVIAVAALGLFALVGRFFKRRKANAEASSNAMGNDKV